MKLFFFAMLLISFDALSADRIPFCNGVFSFIPPKAVDAEFIKYQSKKENCKHDLKIKTKRGSKIATLSFPSESYELDTAAPSKDEIDKIRGNSARTIYQSYLSKSPTGDVKVDTFINQGGDGGVESIEKDFYFSKKDVYSIYAIYKANPNNSDEMEMLNSLEQFFLSLKVDWG